MSNRLILRSAVKEAWVDIKSSVFSLRFWCHSPVWASNLNNFKINFRDKNSLTQISHYKKINEDKRLLFITNYALSLSN